MFPRLTKNPKYHQGYYMPINPLKYLGGQLPIYRSGIELKFFKFLDHNRQVLRWSSETIGVRYFDSVQRKQRTYYIDTFVEIKEGTSIKKYLVELKDHKETIKPIQTPKKKKSTLLYEECQWKTNNCKWSQAVIFARNHGCEFLLLAYSNKTGFQQVQLDFLQ